MGQLIIINAPTSFTAIWSAIKPWLAPRTLDKITFLGANQTDQHAALLDLVSPENLPVALGGTCTCCCSSTDATDTTNTTASGSRSDSDVDSDSDSSSGSSSALPTSFPSTSAGLDFIAYHANPYPCASHCTMHTHAQARWCFVKPRRPYHVVQSSGVLCERQWW
jgi:CRAL/TRIO domain